MPEKILGKMRCPIGAKATRTGPNSFTLEEDAWEHREAPDKINVGGKLIDNLQKRSPGWCPKKGPVRFHEKRRKTLVVDCPVHGAVEANETIWMSQVKK